MSGPRGMFTKSRWAPVSFFALKTPLAGCGFALAFGWLWFPELRVLLVPGLIAGGTISLLYASCLALGAGCFFYGLLCRRLENGDARHRYLNVALAHGVPPLLLGLLLLMRGMGSLSTSILEGTLMGLAGALPGVWWTTRLLASGPGKAIASLAWAAFVSLILSLPLSRMQMDSTVAVCVLIASLVLAWLAALFLVKREGCGEEDNRSDTVPFLEAPYRFGPFRGIYALLLCGVTPIFFCIGSLNVLVLGTDEMLQAIARLYALIVATLILDGPEERTLGISACVLAIMAFCLLHFPELAPILYPVGAGLLEAAAVALCAAILRQESFGQGATAFVAGLFLTVTLAAVNGGELVGRELASFLGKEWTVLPGLMVALLLAAAAYQGRKQPMERTEAARGEAEQEAPFALAASDSIEPTEATNCQPIIEPLTKREQTVASLLAKDLSNKEAAEKLGLTTNALRWHIKNLHKKTGTVNRKELVEFFKKTKAIHGERRSAFSYAVRTKSH